MASASDDFDRADSASTLGANWTAASGTWGIFGNEAYNPSAAGVVYYSTTTFGSDHYAQATAGAFFSSQLISPAVRISAGGDCYFVAAGNIIKTVSTVQTTLTFTGITFGSGDVMKLDATGTTITLYKNGVSAASVTDASLASGQPGMAAGSASVTLNDWSAADTVTPPPPPTTDTIFRGFSC